MHSPFRAIASAVVLALVTVGCTAALDVTSEDATDDTTGDDTSTTDDTSDTSGDDTTGDETSTTDDTNTGEVTAGVECGFDIPDDAEIECVTVEVPEDRDDPTEGTIELAVAVLSSTADDPAPTPTIYLEGGPGGHALATLPFVYEDRYAPLLEQSDVIVFDQRGVGESAPALECPEADDAFDQLAEQPDLGIDDQKQVVLDGYRACRDRLAEAGVAFDSYNSVASAADIDDIRAALGYEQLDLFGISYGTRLALTTMREHPEIVRSAVLDSTLPPEVDATAETQLSLVGSYERFIAACDADSACTERFPDLDQRVRDLAAALDDEPVRAEATDLLTGDTKDVLVDGDVLVGTIIGALYDPTAFGDLPELVADLEDGNTDAIDTFLSIEATNEAFFSVGMFLTVACHEEVAFATPDSVAASSPTDPFWNDYLAVSENVGTFAFEVCDLWNAGSAPAVEDEPVTGDIPTLFLAGDFDPVTPPQWAESAAELLDDAQVVRFPALAHGVTSEPCGMGLAAAFIADPSAPLDISCATETIAPAFVAVADTDIELVAFDEQVAEFGVAVRGVRPADWTPDVTGIQVSRLDGVLDETAIIQLGFDARLVDTLATLIGDEIGIEVADDGTVERGGRTWNLISGRSTSGVTIDVLSLDGEGTVPVVMLVANELERGRLLELVLEPALAAIEVEDV